MRKIFNMSVKQTVPSVESVFDAQGIPQSKQSDNRFARLAEDAIKIYNNMAKPIGILMEVDIDDFSRIYEGEGRNSHDSPVKTIYETSNDLALFAVTIDEEVCFEIARLFRSDNFVIGSMLDSVASEGTEQTAQVLENIYMDHLKVHGRLNPKMGTLRFSPGYCGWHISGQRKIFQSLHPEDIGIELNDSCLMKPIKSISGVIISGLKENFIYEDRFSFCKDCATHSCIERLNEISN